MKSGFRGPNLSGGSRDSTLKLFLGNWYSIWVFWIFRFGLFWIDFLHIDCHMHRLDQKLLQGISPNKKWSNILLKMTYVLFRCQEHWSTCNQLELVCGNFLSTCHFAITSNESIHDDYTKMICFWGKFKFLPQLKKPVDQCWSMKIRKIARLNIIETIFTSLILVTNHTLIFQWYKLHILSL